MRDGQTEKKQSEVLYVYDRICKKDSKARQILQEYGTDVLDVPNAQPNRTSERPFGKAFAAEQLRRAEEALRERESVEGTHTAGAGTHTASKSAWNDTVEREGASYTDSAGNEYIYRPRGVYGGEAVRQHPFLYLREQIYTMFENLDARRKSDEEAARRQAVAHKRFTENRHALITALLLILVTLLFLGFVYVAFFVISDVSVEGSEVYESEAVVEAAGFELGDNLYSFHAGQAEELILFHCPALRTAHISRTVPNSVSIVLEDDTPRYYANIYGEYAVLSSGLRVLGYTSAETAAESGLTRLVLPTVKSSVAGRVLTFASERDMRYIRNVLSAAEGSLLYSEGRIDKIDLSSEHDLRVICDGMYILRLGGEKDSDLKLRMAYKTIEDSTFDREIPASIDLTDFSGSVEASVRYDMRLNIE